MDPRLERLDFKRVATFFGSRRLESAALRLGSLLGGEAAVAGRSAANPLAPARAALPTKANVSSICT